MGWGAGCSWVGGVGAIWGWGGRVSAGGLGGVRLVL